MSPWGKNLKPGETVTDMNGNKRKVVSVKKGKVVVEDTATGLRITHKDTSWFSREKK